MHVSTEYPVTEVKKEPNAYNLTQTLSMTTNKPVLQVNRLCYAQKAIPMNLV